MSNLTVLHQHSPQTGLQPLSLARMGAQSNNVSGLRTQRDRIWELAASLHCSVVGTCLSTAELRQFFAKLGHADARAASDHALHGRAVRAAGQSDLPGKLLSKMLDKRHEAHIKRFAKAKATDGVRELWRAARDSGDVPGAYWAVLTHPAADHALVQEAFGDVHMLSHLVGMSNRADIRRLTLLERQQGESQEKILRQEARLAAMAREREALTARMVELDDRLRQQSAPQPAADGEHLKQAASALRLKLDDVQMRAMQLEAKLQEQLQTVIEKNNRIHGLEQQLAAREDELAALEANLVALSTPGAETSRSVRTLGGRRLLYVGGRPRQIEQLRALVAGWGGHLLAHDGGLEDNFGLLAGLVSQCEVALFPVECVSHHAAGRVKRLCREAGKPFIPVRSASVASFVAALDSFATLPASDFDRRLHAF